MALHRTLLLTALCALPLCACGDEKDDTGPEGDTDADTDTDTDTDADADTDADTDMSATFSGQVLEADGANAEGAVQLCGSRCMNATLDGEGRFTFQNLAAERHGFHTAIEGYAEGLVFYDMVADTANEMPSPYVTIAWEDEITLGNAAQVVSAAGGLMLTLDKNDITLPLGETDYIITSAAPSAEQIPEIDTLEGEIVGMWYLGPFDSRISPPAPFAVVTNPGDFTEGEVLQAWVAGYLETDWLDCGTATVQADGTILSDTGAGLTVLSTLALVR
ncbi:MAG: hypothetical protein ABIO70_35810 [Pseudomonadota bacterium]